MTDINSFGSRIKAERERQGIDLHAVAEETKIRTLYLNALEEENFDLLPPRVYATGFVRRYARFLKMDPDELVKDFQNMAYGNHPDEDVMMMTADNQTPAKSAMLLNIPVKNLLAGAFFLILVIWSGNYILDYINNWSVNQPPSVNEPIMEQPKDIPSAVTEKLVLNIEAREKCWLQVIVDGEQQYSAIMTFGEKLSFEGSQSIYIKAGNAGGIDLFLNQKQLPPLGATGQVVEKTIDLSNIVKE